MKKLMMVMAAALLTLGVRAASEVVDGVTWSYETFSDGGKTCARIIAGADKYIGDLTIPSELGGCSVTIIGDSAFRNCDGLTSMTIPESVRSIEGRAFMDCCKLSSVMISKGVDRIGWYAFYGCNGLIRVDIIDLAKWCEISFDGSAANPLYYAHHLNLNGVEVRNLVVPEGVTIIGCDAFHGCWGIKTVTIPASVTSIGLESEEALGGGDAFSGCSGLTSVEFLGAPPSNISSSLLLRCDVLRIPREYGAAWRKLFAANSFPGYGWGQKQMAEIVSSVIRENDPTVMDVVYKVTSMKPMVKVRPLAFQDGERSFAKVVRPTEFIEDTAKNIGDEIAANEEHKLSWRVSADWKADLAKVKFEVLAVEDDLLPLELTTIPKVGEHAAMEISWNAVSEQQVFDALLWMYADGDEGLVLSDGVLKRASDGCLLGYGTTVSIWNGRYSKNVTGNGSTYYYFAPAIDYVYSKMGFSVLSGEELKYANEMTRLGLSPSGVRQYAWRTVEE